MADVSKQEQEMKNKGMSLCKQRKTKRNSKPRSEQAAVQLKATWMNNGGPVPATRIDAYIRWCAAPDRKNTDGELKKPEVITPEQATWAIEGFDEARLEQEAVE